MKNIQIRHICKNRFAVHNVLVYKEECTLKTNTYHVHFLGKCSSHYWGRESKRLLLCRYT